MSSFTPSVAVIATIVTTTVLGCKGAPPSKQDTEAKPEQTPGAEIRNVRKHTWFRPSRAGAETVGEFPARVLTRVGSVVEVSAPAAGKLLNIAIAPGDKVAVGDELFRLSSPELAAAKVTVEASAEQLAVLSRRRSELDKLREEGLVRASELTALDLEIAKTKGERMRAQSALSAAGDARPDSRGVLRMRSPIAGIVTQAMSVVGSQVKPESVITSISEASGNRVEASLPFPPAPHSEARLVVPGAPEIPLKLIAQSPSEHQGTYSTRAWFEAKSGAQLPLDRQVRLRFVTTKGALCIPDSAVSTARGTPQVFWRLPGKPPEKAVVNVITAGNGKVCVDLDLAENAEVSLDPASLELTND